MVQITDSEHLRASHAAGVSDGSAAGDGEYKRLMVEFVKILDDVQIDDQLQLKLMLLANCRKNHPEMRIPITAVFMAAEHRQPLLIEMKGGAQA